MAPSDKNSDSSSTNKSINSQTAAINSLVSAISGMKKIAFDKLDFSSLEDKISKSFEEQNKILREHSGFLQRIAECCEEGDKKGSKKGPSSAAKSPQSAMQDAVKSGALDKFKAGIKDSGKLGNTLANVSKTAVSASSKFGKFIGIISKLGKFTKVLGGPWTIAVQKAIGVWMSGFTMISRFAISLSKSLIGLSLKIAESAVATGNSIRENITKTIGESVEAVKDTFDLGSTIGEGFRKVDEQAKSYYLMSEDVSNEFTKLFGTGSSAVARYVGELTSSISNMGTFADALGGSIMKSKESTIGFIKTIRGLGLSADDIKYFAMQSVKNLSPVHETFDDIIVSISQTSKTFGVDRKKLSKDFMILRKDITNFGHLSNQELTRTAARLTQLGVSGDAATAVFNKFDTFESAAQSAAMMSQAFGMNVDALQLIKAENPLEIIEALRESLYMTGKSFDTMGRFEKSYMSQITGMNAEQLSMIMNFRSMGMSFDEIQHRLKESDPTEQQRKNIASMTDSIKEIRNIFKGSNIFGDFITGLKTTIYYGTSFSSKFERASKVAQDFFVKGLKISDSAKKSLESLFKPLGDSLDEMFGTEGGKEGIFNAGNFSKIFESFTTEYSDLFAKVFDKSYKLTDVQAEFTKKLTATFDPDTLLSSNNIGIQLLRSGGKLVGQLLRGAAAIGPGLIEIVGNAITGIADWITGKGGEGDSLFGGPSFRKLLVDLFDLREDDLNAIFNNFEVMFKTLFDKIIPALGRIIAIVTPKIAELVTPLAIDIGKSIAKGIWDGITSFIGRNKFTVAGSIIGTFFGGPIGTAIGGGIGYILDSLGGGEDKSGNQNTTQSANDAASDMFSGRTTALMQRGSSGYNITNFADGDQVVAGMPKGPIVEGIRYSGNVAAGLSKLIRSNIEAGQEGRSSGGANQRPIEVILTLDSEVVARQLLSEADLIGKAGRLEYTRGSTRLQSRAMVNPTGGSTEASSLG